MYLSEEAIEEFREVWKQEYGEEITYEYASIRAEQVLRLVSMLVYPGPQQGQEGAADLRSSKKLLESMRTMISVEEPNGRRRGRTKPE